MNLDIIAAAKLIEKERNIPFEMVVHAIEDALKKAYDKHFGEGHNVAIEIDRHSGELRIWKRKLVVPEVENPDLEMSLEEAQELAPEAELGMEIDFQVPNETFGRIAAQTAKQVIVQKIREFERNTVKEEFSKRVGELVTGTAQRYEHRALLVDLGRAEGVIPPSEQAHNEWFRHGDRLKAYVLEVRDTQRGPQVVLSRSSPGLLKKLFEMEVPEIRQGIVQIKAVVREAGLRSKIAVKSLDSSVDPVGACVGPKGTRVQAVVDELRGEKIDVIPWSDDPLTFVANALQPARVSRVTLFEDTRSATVVVPDLQLSLAIGREGQNARLAAKLTGWHIDIKSESQARDLEAQEAAARRSAPAPGAAPSAPAAGAPPAPAAGAPRAPAPVARGPAAPPAEKPQPAPEAAPQEQPAAPEESVVGIDPSKAFSAAEVLGRELTADEERTARSFVEGRRQRRGP
jgi:N utilization substance protein A